MKIKVSSSEKIFQHQTFQPQIQGVAISNALFIGISKMQTLKIKYKMKVRIRREGQVVLSQVHFKDPCVPSLLASPLTSL